MEMRTSGSEKLPRSRSEWVGVAVVAVIATAAGLGWLALGAWQMSRATDILGYQRAEGVVTKAWVSTSRKGPSDNMVDVVFVAANGKVHEFHDDNPRFDFTDARAGDIVPVIYDPRDGNPATTARVRTLELYIVNFAAGPAVFAFGIVWLAVVWLWVRHGESGRRPKDAARGASGLSAGNPSR